jgi:hypothetical protein
LDQKQFSTIDFSTSESAIHLLSERTKELLDWFKTEEKQAKFSTSLFWNEGGN